MAKIKNLNKVKFANKAMSKILGGYDNIPNEFDINGGFDDKGAGGKTCSSCSGCLCMPGDNCDYASYIGTSAAQNLFGWYSASGSSSVS